MEIDSGRLEIVSGYLEVDFKWTLKMVWDSKILETYDGFWIHGDEL